MAPTAFSERPHAVLLLLVPSIILFTLAWTVYRAFWGPLSNVPGPAISRWTKWQLKIAVLRGERTRYVHALHQKYGPIVRTAPNEISVADIDAARKIYKVASPFLKSSWYDGFTGSQPNKNAFSAIDNQSHGYLRKLNAVHFSEKWVAKMEPFIARNTQLAVDRMHEEAAKKKHANIFKWFMFMATDVIGEASFGESFRMLETRKENQYYLDLQAVGSKAVLRSEFVPLFKALAKTPLRPAREMYAIVWRLTGYGEESLNRYWRQLRAEPDNVKPTLLTNEYALVEKGEVTFEQILRDATGYLIAGTDTTAITATNAVWLLSKHPAIEQELIQAVSQLPTDFTDHDLKQVDILQNVIKETLRLAGAVQQGLPRVVPATGAEFCGHYIAGGVVVGAQAYTMHRDPQIWERAGEFIPQRWEAPTQDQLHSYYPFGGGSRICLGMHFAQLELRHALANFYRKFDCGVRMSSADGFNEDEMTPMSYFLEPPKGKRCLIEPRKALQ